jgi:hypothetical protein
MPTYRNITPYSISLKEGNVPSMATIELERYLYTNDFVLVDELPLPTNIHNKIGDIAQISFRDSPTIPIEWSASLGLIAGVAALKKFGYNPNLSLTGGTIWDGGGYYIYLTSPAIMKIASSSADDTELGVGVREVIAIGLDSNWDEVTYTVKLNGQTPVVLGEMIRIFKMEVSDTGSLAHPSGELYASDGTFTDGIPDGNTYATIKNGGNQTLMALYTVPSGYTALILDYYTTTGKDGEVFIDSMFRPYGRPNFNIKRRIAMYESSFTYSNRVPYAVPEKTDIELRGVAITKAAPVGAGFDIILIRN